MMRPAASSGQRISQQAFETIAQVARAELGILLPAEKITMVQSRLRKRMHKIGIEQFDDYARLVTSDRGKQERQELISVLTTNVSHFMREAHHFDILERELLPALCARLSQGGRVRIWSAGCANGQEPYSIAMVLLKAEPRIAEWDLRILATDIDPKVIRFAQAGLYDDGMLGGLNAQDREQFFQTVPTDRGPAAQVRPELRGLVRFRVLNLLRDWPMRNAFDIIFCRNVVIYFGEDTQAGLWPRFVDHLRIGGRLFLGHSERIPNPSGHGLRLDTATSYVRLTA